MVLALAILAICIYGFVLLTWLGIVMASMVKIRVEKTVSSDSTIQGLIGISSPWFAFGGRGEAGLEP